MTKGEEKRGKKQASRDLCRMQFYERSATFYCFVTLQLNWFGWIRMQSAQQVESGGLTGPACRGKPKWTGGQASSRMELARRPRVSRYTSIIMKSLRFGAPGSHVPILVHGACCDILTVTLQPFVQKFPDKLLGERKVWRGGWEKVIWLDVGQKTGSVSFDSSSFWVVMVVVLKTLLHTEAQYTCQSCLINAVLLFTHSSVTNKSNNCII